MDQPANHPVSHHDWYETARIDAAVVAGLTTTETATGPPPFWLSAYTSTIRWIKTAAELAGAQEPNLQEVATLLADADRLKDLIDKASTASVSDTESTARVRKQVRKWLENDWNGLNPRLQTSIGAGIRKATEQNVRIRRRGTSATIQLTPIGKRRGPWNEWDTGSLPGQVQGAIWEARYELGYGQCRQEGDQTPKGPAELLQKVQRISILLLQEATRLRKIMRGYQQPEDRLKDKSSR